ncbi:MAG TPA: glycosyltransferase 87 family protein [bacterium]|nr:glycosyltransferase 87 family protein [bacterium]HPN32047.1 glycosyltransferase 87 family protein [bacterium]
MNYFIYKEGFGFSDLTCFTEALKYAVQSGCSPYFKSYAGSSITGSGFYYSPAFLSYVSLFVKSDYSANLNLYLFLNIFYLIAAFAVWIRLCGLLNKNAIISLLFLLIITHFHPGIIWNAAAANNNELSFLFATLSCYFFVKEKNFFSGLFLALLFLIKIHFTFFYVFFLFAFFKNKKFKPILLSGAGFFLVVMIAILIVQFPVEWWKDWLKFIYYRFSLAEANDRIFIDQSFSKFGSVGIFLRYLSLAFVVLFSLKTDLSNNKDKLFLCAISLAAMILFLKNAWIQYVIFFIPLQITALNYLTFPKSGILNITAAVFLTLSLIFLNGPFPDNKTVVLKTLQSGIFKDIALIVINKIRVFGFLFILGLVAVMTLIQYKNQK